MNFRKASLLIVGAVMVSALPLSIDIFGQKSTRKICGPTANERLKTYLELNEEKPAQIINNVDGDGLWESKMQSIKIGDHVIEWTDKVEKLTTISSIKIDDQILTFTGIQSINEADENRRIDIDVVGEWRQIKLYELFDQEIIGVTVGPRSCTGLMCGVAAQILYDVRTKKATFFGTFRADNEVRLFRFKNEDVFYYLAKRFDGDPHGFDKASVTYSAYALKPNGVVELKRNYADKPYFIKYTYYPSVFDTRSKKNRPATRSDILEQNWIEKID